MHAEAPGSPHVVAGPSAGTRGQLALSMQEALTAAVRLREGRQIPTDAAVFRTQVKTLLGQADREARAAGYPPEFVKLAVYAVIAFLDEAVLHSSQRDLAEEWSGRPLQEEIFGDTVAGEIFFQHLDQLLSRQDSAFVADILEVYLLCIFLGFKGRYASSDGTALRSLTAATYEKIHRIRGGATPLSPRGLPPAEEQVVRAGDPLARKLVTALVAMAAGLVLLILVLRIAFLAGGVTDVTGLVG